MPGLTGFPFQAFIAAVTMVLQQSNPVDSLSVPTLSSLPPPSPSSSPLAAILFDIDGTLVNSDPIHFAVFRDLLLQQDGFNNNEPIDEAFFRTWISGRANPLITADFFPHWSIEQRQHWSMIKEAKFREQAQQSMKESKMPGLDRLRDWIDQQQQQQNPYPGLGKAAVTNAPRANAEAILQGIDYDDWFGSQFLIIGDECEKPKPDPCPYLTACQRLKVQPHECIVFEDSPSGAKAGVAAGAWVVGILSGQSESALRNAGCHMIIQDFDDPKLWTYLEQRIKHTRKTKTMDESTIGPTSSLPSSQ